MGDERIERGAVSGCHDFESCRVKDDNQMAPHHDTPMTRSQRSWRTAVAFSGALGARVPIRVPADALPRSVGGVRPSFYVVEQEKANLTDFAKQCHCLIR
jgi:hypothetical protein